MKALCLVLSCLLLIGAVTYTTEHQMTDKQEIDNIMNGLAYVYALAPSWAIGFGMYIILGPEFNPLWSIAIGVASYIAMVMEMLRVGYKDDTSNNIFQDVEKTKEKRKNGN